MTKKHFQSMAATVRAILYGHWTNDAPAWADRSRYDASDADWDGGSATAYRYTRAVQTAEAFIAVAREWNPRFDTHRFLVACGLAEPAKRRRIRAALP